MLYTVVSRGMVLVMQQATQAPDQTSTSEPPVLVTAKIAGQILGLSAWHVQKLLDSGELASTKIGRTLFIPTQSIEDYKLRVAAAPKTADQ